MDAKARRALRVIQECVGCGRIIVLRHFVQRMDERGLFWADVETLIDSPSSVLSVGEDEYGRPKWLIRGAATDGLEVEIVCALERDDRGHWTVFITAYWK